MLHLFSDRKNSDPPTRTGTSSPNQETITRHWSHPTHGGQTPQIRGTMTFKSAERKPQIQKIKQNEKTEKYASDEGTW